MTTFANCVSLLVVTSSAAFLRTYSDSRSHSSLVLIGNMVSVHF